jgi:hypothetical protein
MRILTITAITAMALPFMALGQTTEPQQTQGQTKEPQTTAPAKGKKVRPEQEQAKPQAKPETGTNMRAQPQPNVKSRAQEPSRNEQPGVNKNEPGKTEPGRTESGMRSGTSRTDVNQSTNVNQSTRVNVQEFKARHSEVFSLGRHPKEFFVQRFGANHVRLIGNSYFVFVDGCWVAVDVDGFVYSERIICAGDPEFIEIE